MKEKYGDRKYEQQNLFPDDSGSIYEQSSKKKKDEEAKVILGLSEQKGIGFKSIKKLYEAGGISNYTRWQKSRLVEKLAECLHRPTSKQVENLAQSKRQLLEQGEKKLEVLSQRGIDLITTNHSDFPVRILDQMDDPPRWLFVRGDPKVLKEESMVGVVGTRNPSKYGKWLARRCASELAKSSFIVLSGLAKGVDSASHRGAVEVYARTIAVLGHGIEESLLSSDQQRLAEEMLRLDGAIVSEYLPNDPPSRDGYLRRNEVVSALSGLIIPIECPSLQSGTGATIRRAQQMETPVAGIKPKNRSDLNEALIKTEDNYHRIGIPMLNVFTRSGDLWNFLRETFPHHDWHEDKKRHRRFYKVIADRVSKANKHFSFEEGDLDEMIDVVKNEIID